MVQTYTLHTLPLHNDTSYKVQMCYAILYYEIKVRRSMCMCVYGIMQIQHNFWFSIDKLQSQIFFVVDANSP